MELQGQMLCAFFKAVTQLSCPEKTQYTHIHKESSHFYSLVINLNSMIYHVPGAVLSVFYAFSPLDSQATL